MPARNHILLAAACAAAMAGAGASASEEKKSMSVTLPTPYVTVEGITEYRLPNGLCIVLYPDASKPTATVNMTYLVGSRQENYGETGMAHLLEHLMFKGSKNYPNPTAEFTKRGFRMNGSTWLDRTNYFVSFTATDDNMRWALGWQADAMTNSRSPSAWGSTVHSFGSVRSGFGIGPKDSAIQPSTFSASNLPETVSTALSG